MNAKQAYLRAKAARLEKKERNSLHAEVDCVLDLVERASSAGLMSIDIRSLSPSACDYMQGLGYTVEGIRGAMHCIAWWKGD
jgi:hypothetical protein